MINLEQAAWNNGAQLWMYPSTVQSTLGGFLAGGSRYSTTRTAAIIRFLG